MANEVIQIPDFDFSAFYYPDFLRALIAFTRQNVPEITDESDEEPFTQILRAFALVGHLNNVLLDITATETLLPSARLLESVRSHLKLIDVILEQNIPASVDMVFELSKIFTTPTNFVPVGTQVATEETDDSPQVIFEASSDNIIDPTNQATAIRCWNPAVITWLDNSFAGGDKLTITTADGSKSFTAGIDFAVGGSLAATITNFVEAFNSSTSEVIEDKLFAHETGSKVIINLIDTDVLSIALTKIDTGIANWTLRDGSYGPNYAGEANLSAVLFNMFTDTIEPGSIFYVQHNSIMWDTLDFKFNTFGSGFEGVWEFYDGDTLEANPDSVTNLGANLELDLTDLLGTEDRSGTRIRILYSPSGAVQYRASIYSGGVNKVLTSDLLGQVVVSTDKNEYIVGSVWNEVNDLSDITAKFTKNGKISYTLPQSLVQNWIQKSINGVEGFPIRFRVISTTAPVSPIIDLLKIDKGKQYLLFNAVQGESRSDNPLGSSSGTGNQSFTLNGSPLLVSSLVIEVDEGTGFSAWNKVDNFLNSTQTSKDYTLEVFADDTAVITFGDGVQGKIPAAGVDNVRAAYRTGGDVNGNVGSLTISINKSGIAFVNRVFNPRSATGHAFKEGSTEEDLARLKIEGPASLRVRNRAITTDDFEFLARDFTDSVGSKPVVRALAIEETYGVKTIEVVVVGTGGNLLTQNQLDELTYFFNGNKPLGIVGVGLTNHEASLVNYSPKKIDVSVTVTGGTKSLIENAIKALLNPEAKFSDGVTNRWDFGDLVPLAVIISEIIEVDPINIKNAVLTLPTGDIQLGTRELPVAGTISVTVI